MGLGGVSGGGGGVDGSIEEQSQTNLPFRLLRDWGASQCINVQVMSFTSSIYDHFII